MLTSAINQRFATLEDIFTLFVAPKISEVMNIPDNEPIFLFHKAHSKFDKYRLPTVKEIKEGLLFYIITLSDVKTFLELVGDNESEDQSKWGKLKSGFVDRLSKYAGVVDAVKVVTTWKQVLSQAVAEARDKLDPNIPLTQGSPWLAKYGGHFNSPDYISAVSSSATDGSVSVFGFLKVTDATVITKAVVPKQILLTKNSDKLNELASVFVEHTVIANLDSMFKPIILTGVAVFNNSQIYKNENQFVRLSDIEEVGFFKINMYSFDTKNGEMTPVEDDTNTPDINEAHTTKSYEYDEYIDQDILMNDILASGKDTIQLFKEYADLKEKFPKFNQFNFSSVYRLSLNDSLGITLLETAITTRQAYDNDARKDLHAIKDGDGNYTLAEPTGGPLFASDSNSTPLIGRLNRNSGYSYVEKNTDSYASLLPTPGTAYSMYSISADDSDRPPIMQVPQKLSDGDDSDSENIPAAYAAAPDANNQLTTPLDWSGTQLRSLISLSVYPKVVGTTTTATLSTNVLPQNILQTINSMAVTSTLFDRTNAGTQSTVIGRGRTQLDDLKYASATDVNAAVGAYIIPWKKDPIVYESPNRGEGGTAYIPFAALTNKAIFQPATYDFFTPIFNGANLSPGKRAAIFTFMQDQTEAELQVAIEQYGPPLKIYITDFFTDEFVEAVSTANGITSEYRRLRSYFDDTYSVITGDYPSVGSSTVSGVSQAEWNSIGLVSRLCKLYRSLTFPIQIKFLNQFKNEIKTLYFIQDLNISTDNIFNKLAFEITLKYDSYNLSIPSELKYIEISLPKPLYIKPVFLNGVGEPMQVFNESFNLSIFYNGITEESRQWSRPLVSKDSLPYIGWRNNRTVDDTGKSLGVENLIGVPPKIWEQQNVYIVIYLNNE